MADRAIPRAEMTPGPRVVLYGKPECHLCDGARVVLERVRAEHPFELVECDITTDDGLLKAYFDRIPVVTVDGAEMFEYFVDEAALRNHLESSR